MTAGALQLTADAGLRVDDVLVVGREQTDPGALLEKVGVERGMAILGIDLADMRDRVVSLPWVKEARIERRLPDTLHVTLVERRPLALWQRGRDFTLVDQDGVTIDNQDVRQFHNLPIVIGEEAPERAAAALAMLSGEPELGPRVRALSLGQRPALDHPARRTGWTCSCPRSIRPGRGPTWPTLAREHGVLERDVVDHRPANPGPADHAGHTVGARARQRARQEYLRPEEGHFGEKALGKARSGLVAALDIGSSKVCCFVAKIGDPPSNPLLAGAGLPAGSIRVAGIGHQVSRGVKAGRITDVDQLEASILNAVHAAEKMAGAELRSVMVNISGGWPASQTVGVEVSVRGTRGRRQRPAPRARPVAPSGGPGRPGPDPLDPGRLSPSTAPTASAIRAACSARPWARTCTL
ncbi:MAG: FtsQ-type POTRA domain-containing protein [Thalassobaculum sp.]